MGSTVAEAARALAAGRLVLYPTDTLLGLAARASNPSAVDRLIALKGRARTQPLSFAVSSTEEIEPLGMLSPTGRRFLRTHLPGPFTVLIGASRIARRALAPTMVGVTGTIGIRVPDHPLARELARRAGPITATSANRHGAPPAVTVAEARREFGAEIAVYLPAIPRPSGVPSRLVDLTDERPRGIPRT